MHSVLNTLFVFSFNVINTIRSLRSSTYMSFDRFLLAVESRDLAQADKILTRSSVFFPKAE